MTCLSRAASSLESAPHYKSDDHIARSLLPNFFKFLIHIPIFRTSFTRIIAPRGIYEYVIARTKYIDGVFKQAVNEQFAQILIFGAGFDTRALRFDLDPQTIKVFELDVPVTQQAKLGQYQKRRIKIPPNVVFIPVDFDQESLPGKLTEAGFQKGRRSLFILEGVLMYLQPVSVNETFRTIQDYAGEKSWVVFDYVQESVLRDENHHYGGRAIVKTVSQAGEQWQFGIQKDEIEDFLARYDLLLRDHKDAQALEAVFFKDENGRIVGHINDTHCLVTAEKV